MGRWIERGGEKKINKTWRENSTLSSCALYLTCASCSGLFTSRQSQRISRFSIRGHKKRRKGKKKICFPSNKNRIICGAQRWSKLNPAEQRFRGRQGHVGRAWPLHQAFRNISTVPFWRQYGSTRADNHHQLLLGRAGKKRFFLRYTKKKNSIAPFFFFFCSAFLCIPILTKVWDCGSAGYPRTRTME